MQMLALLGQWMHFCLSLAKSARSNPRILEDCTTQLYKTLAGAIPLVAVAGLATGIVVWLHLRGLLVGVAGPSSVSLLPQALSLAVVVELAPLTAALILAGRSGSSLAAELASMKQSEQIDALQAMGVNPMGKLVFPRVIACTMALPMLTIFTAYLSLLSGYLTESITGTMAWSEYYHQVIKVLKYRDAVPAVTKTIFFGLGIGTLACFHGLNAGEGTEGVGRAATRGVVGSIFFVLVSNVFLVKLIHLLFD